MNPTVFTPPPTAGFDLCRLRRVVVLMLGIGITLGLVGTGFVTTTNTNTGIGIGIGIGEFSFSALRTADGFTTLRTSIGQRVKWDMTNANNRPNIVNGRVMYLIGIDGCDDAASFTGGINEFAAIRRAMEAWNDVPHSTFRSVYLGGTTNTAINGSDNLNTIIFEKTGRLDVSTFGLTTTTFLTNTGEIVDSDVELNDARFNWDTVGNRTVGGNNRAYIEHVMAHEAGHFFGLDHSPLAASTMVAASPTGAINQASLEAEDHAGVSTFYPSASFASAYATVRGKVTKVGAGDVFGASVAVINVENWRVVTCAFTEANGTYEIAGIPPGEYWLLVAPIQTNRYSSFYSSADTNFVPQLHGVATNAVGTPTVFALNAGDLVTTNTDFAVSAISSPDVFEGGSGNNTAPTATPIAYGQAAVARLAPSNDVDFFQFSAAGNDVIDLVVIGHQAGSPIDARFTLFESNQTTRLISPLPQFPGDPTYDIRAEDADNTAFDLNGFNRDPLIPGYQVPAAKGGTLYLRIEQLGGAPSNAWYVFTVVRPAAVTAVSPAATSLAMSPGSLVAGSGQTATATVVARNMFGHVLGSVAGGASLHVGATTIPMTETPANSGTWIATIPAAGSAGSDTVTATVGGVALHHALTIYYTDTISTTNSTVEAQPTGLFADGVSTATIIVTPKDTGSRPVKDAALVVDIASSLGTVGAVTFHTATGTFRASLTAPTSPGTATITASIVGAGLTSQATVEFDDDPAPYVPPPPNTKQSRCGVVPRHDFDSPWSLAPFAVLLVLLLASARFRRINNGIKHA